MSRPDREPSVAVDFAPRESRGTRPLVLALLFAVILAGVVAAVTQLLLR